MVFPLIARWFFRPPTQRRLSHNMVVCQCLMSVFGWHVVAQWRFSLGIPAAGRELILVLGRAPVAQLYVFFISSDCES